MAFADFNRPDPELAIWSIRQQNCDSLDNVFAAASPRSFPWFWSTVMSNVVSWSLQMSVREGRLDDAKALVPEMVAATRDEAGALTYEYFLSDDGTSCHIYERYADSDAVMAHLGNFGANFADRFMACFEPTSLSVYGQPSDEVRAALDGFGAVYLATLDGFRR